jgi:lysophospholipase L1-like esterase
LYSGIFKKRIIVVSKKTIIIVLILFFAASYLFIAKWFIYHRIGSAALKASDDRHMYVFNDSLIPTPTTRLVYVALGDSLTSGVGVNAYEESYPYLLAQKIAATSTKVTHLNFSYPGARTEDALRDLVPNAVNVRADVITILLGTNDVMNGKVTDSQFRNNYEALIKAFVEGNKVKINLISIPYIGSNSLFLPPFNYYYREKINRFNLIIKELAMQYNLNYIDLTTPTAQFSSQVSDYYAKDDFHLSRVGYVYWSNILYDNLNK